MNCECGADVDEEGNEGWGGWGNENEIDDF